MIRPRQRPACESGQATVEFAIIIPLLLLLVVGIIEFGKAFNYWIDLNHLANEGARWTAVEKVPPANANPSPGDIKAYLISQISSSELQSSVAPDGSGNVNSSNVSICYTPSLDENNNPLPPQVGDAITVRVSAPYSFPFVSSVAGAVAGLFGGDGSGIGDITLKGSSTMRLEQLPPQDSTTQSQWVQCEPPPSAPLIDTHPPDPDISTDATFTFHDTSGQANITFQCSIDNHAYKTCTSNDPPPPQYTGLEAGGVSHIFRVRAHNDEQNQVSAPAIYRWTIS